MPVSAAHWFKSSFSLQTPQEPTKASPSASGNLLQPQDQSSQPQALQQKTALDRFQKNHPTAASASEEERSSTQLKSERKPTSEASRLSLADMPEDIRLKIAASMRSDDPLIDYLDLSALRSTSKALKATVDTHEPYKTLSSTLKTKSSQPDPAFIQHSLSKLATLSPRQRKELIDLTLSLKQLNSKLNALKTCAQNLEALEPELKDQLIKAAANLKAPVWKAPALQAFVLQSKSLNPKQIEKLISATASVKDERCRSIALQAFAIQPELFNPTQIDKFIKDAVTMKNEDGKAPALQAFAEKLELYTPSQKDQLIRAIASLEYYQSKTIIAFAQKLDCLSPEQREQLEKINGGRPLLVPGNA